MDHSRHRKFKCVYNDMFYPSFDLLTRATASKYKSLIFRYAFQPLTLNSHSGISKLTLIIRQLYPCENFDAVALSSTTKLLTIIMKRYRSVFPVNVFLRIATVDGVYDLLSLEYKDQDHRVTIGARVLGR